MYIRGKIIITRGRTLLSGPPLCRGRKVRDGDGRKGRGRHNFKKGKGKKGRGRVPSTFIYVRIHACVFTCSVAFSTYRVQFVLSTTPMNRGKKNDVNDINGYERYIDNDGD